ncbi:arginyltransferase [Glaciecola sp. XM2]|uniref:arginyltransferase n=1 Tax=Glaciecola sp. XM2 TaxID=1914931 RepID=UPI001BDEEF28|nr:arginyltransferase [Glaciecola sp. XM2]MBT1449371.1 arginyltransferase [Glaciecola sp. XM2]
MKFGITQRFTCNYLPEYEEQLLVSMAPANELNELYSQLMHSGFRRSGEQLYRPHCPDCRRCNSVRVLTGEFSPSKSQKRILAKNKHIKVKMTSDQRDDHYPLYERYISAFHADGTMYPPSYTQYRNFIACQWQQPVFLEARQDDGSLLAVAVTDRVKDGLSALYTYYSPDFEKHSLGKFMIMQQIYQADAMGLPFLYLGYQIDECRKMNYKTAFEPYQRLIDNRWVQYP